MKKLLPLFSLALLAGCVPPPLSQVNVNYSCDPIGAKLVEDGTGKIFSCPATLSYGVSQANLASGYLTANGLTAIWVSGAKSHLKSVVAPLSAGAYQHYTFQRDPTAPGAYTDAEYALQLQNQATQQGFLNAQQQQVQMQQQQQQQIDQQNLDNAAFALGQALARIH